MQSICQFFFAQYSIIGTTSLPFAQASMGAAVTIVFVLLSAINPAQKWGATIW
jgi:hypothetical protein